MHHNDLKSKGLQLRDCNSYGRFKPRQKSRENEPSQPQIMKLQSQQYVKKIPSQNIVIGRPKTKSVMHSQQAVGQIVQKGSKKHLCDPIHYQSQKNKKSLIKNRTKKTHSLSYYHYDSLQNEQDEINQHISNMSFKDHILIDSEGKFKTQITQPSNDLLEGKRLFGEGQTDLAQKIFYDVLLSSNNPEARYLVGVCALQKQDFQEAINQLQQLITFQPLFKRNAYILLAIAFKKMNNPQQAIVILTQAIKQFNKYSDAYIYRGKTYLKLQQWEKAAYDFQQAIDIQPNKAVSYIGQAEALKQLNQCQQSIHMYSKAIDCNDSMKKSALLKRTLLYIEQKEYKNALTDIQTMMDIEPCDSQALYLRGFVQSKQNQIADALLSYEQAIKHNNSRKAVTKSLFEIAKLKIEQRDFYGAFYQLNRAEYLEIDYKVIQRFKIFTDGVTFLMKRKFDDGLECLNQLSTDVNDFIKPLIFQYRAYGYFCLSQYQKCLNDLNQVQSLEKPSIYNKLISQGITFALQNQFEQSQGYFLKAQKLIPSKMEPYFYKATTLIRLYNYLIPKDDQAKRTKFLSDAIKYMDKAVEICEQSNLLFYRAIVLFAMDQLDLSLIDLDKAIEKSEDNVPKHFYTRGLLQASRKAYKLALNDLTITINLDEKFTDAYYNRGRVFQILGDRNNAYYDILKYLELNPHENQALINAGNMLYYIGAYEEAVKTYTLAERSSATQYLKAKCYIILKELNNAMQDLQQVYDLTNDINAYVDFNLLHTLKLTSSSQDESGYKESIQLIGSITKKNYEGKIFKKSDILFYQGLYHCYCAEFELAQDNIRKAYDLKEESQASNRLNDSDQFILESLAEPLVLQTKIKVLEEYEFFDRTFNLYEYLFNMSILDIFLGKTRQAIEQLTLLSENIRKDEKYEELIQFIELMTQDLNDDPIIDDLTVIEEICIFPQHNRLCSIYPALQIPLRKYQQQLEVRLSFCLPQIEMPNMNFSFDERLLEQINPTVVENKPEAPWIKRAPEGVIFTDNIQNFGDLDLESTTRPNNEEEAQQDQNQDFQDQEEKQNVLDQNIPQEDSIVEDAIDQRKAFKQSLMLDAKISDKLDQLLKKRK